MPIYQYECPICHQEKELLQKMTDDAPTCDNPDHTSTVMAKKLSSKTTWVFKGGKDWG